MKINLLPEEHRPQPIVNVYRVGFLIFIGICVLVSGIIYINAWIELNSVKTKLTQVEQDIIIYGQSYENVKHIEQLENTVKKKRKEMESITKPYLPFDRLLSEVIRCLPDKLWLLSMDINEQGKISLAGVTNRLNAISNYMVELEFSPEFKQVVLSDVNANIQGEEQYLYKFNLTFEQEKAGAANGK